MKGFSCKYLKLVKRVRKIDNDAAEYMLNEAPKIRDWIDDEDLSASFTWGWSKQGHDFWSKIKEQLGEMDELKTTKGKAAKAR